MLKTLGTLTEALGKELSCIDCEESQHSQRSLLEYKKLLLALKPLFLQLIYYHIFPRAPTTSFSFTAFKGIAHISRILTSSDVLFKLALSQLTCYSFRGSLP